MKFRHSIFALMLVAITAFMTACASLPNAPAPQIQESTARQTVHDVSTTQPVTTSPAPPASVPDMPASTVVDPVLSQVIAVATEVHQIRETVVSKQDLDVKIAQAVNSGSQIVHEVSPGSREDEIASVVRDIVFAAVAGYSIFKHGKTAQVAITTPGTTSVTPA